VDGTPVSFIKSIDLNLQGKDIILKEEPFQLSFTSNSVEREKLSLKIKLQFMGHYLEPPMELNEVITTMKSCSTQHHLEYNPFQREWKLDPNQTASILDLKDGMDTMNLEK